MKLKYAALFSVVAYYAYQMIMALQVLSTVMLRASH